MYNKKKIIIVSILVVTLIIGISFALFFTNVKGPEKVVKLGTLKVEYVDGGKINFANSLPLKETQVDKYAPRKKFSVTNTGDLDGYIEISLTSINMSEELKIENFRYVLYNDEYEIAKGNFSNVVDNKIKIRNNLFLESGKTKNFSIALWIHDDDSNQNGLLNKSFSAKITIDMYDKNVAEDKSGANEPVLATGLIPVIYDEKSEKWEVADTNESWYNYEDGMWANAVTVNDANLRSAPAGTELDMSKINSMWVWIPRYKYRIPSNLGSDGDVTNPPTIDVVFENGTETTGESLADCPIDATDCYYTHPAFRNGSEVYKTTAYDQGGWDKELKGIWVGKFETGTQGDNCSSSSSEDNCKEVTPVIKPDVKALRYQTVDTQFIHSLKLGGGTFNTSTGEVSFTANTNNIYGLNTTSVDVDTHMMKNTEWGAVTYLSQSRYGKMGNLNYSGVNKEIYVGNSSLYYTGRSGGGPSGSTSINEVYAPNQTSTTNYNSTGFYTYDDYLLNYDTNTKGNKVVNKGAGASTTGTIYGIYDMSGGIYENTMSNWAETIGSSRFTTFPSQKYWDKYTGTSNINATADKSIKGDATYETQKWYSDSSSLINSSNPWTIRGGVSYGGSAIGIFYSNSYNGASNYDYGFRFVLVK